MSGVWSTRQSEQDVSRPGDPRLAYERDRARVIHSAAFRRLQAKTQILGGQEGDFHRTRLTHSMEVAQIGRGLVLVLQHRHPERSEELPTLELMETVGLAHDLGHPPFGHGGEVALNCVMSGIGGFEGNGQTLRLLTLLESHTPQLGLNLTRRALLGVLKYPVSYQQVNRLEEPPRPPLPRQIRRTDWHPPKCYLDTEAAAVDWILAPLGPADRDRFQQSTPAQRHTHGQACFKSLDASLMELADDIAYGIHDFEDGLALRLLHREHCEAVWEAADPDWLATHELDPEALTEQLLSGGSRRKQAVGALVNALVTSVELVRDEAFVEPLLAWNVRLPDAAATLLEAFKAIAFRHIICLNTVQAATYRGHQIIMALFDALHSDPGNLLPAGFRQDWEVATTPAEQARVLCDYISGMTDQYANRTYERLFIPRQGSVFDRT